MANGPTDTDRSALRDMFAAAALAGLQAHHDYGQQTNEWVANEAYSLADAMLLARAGTNDTEPPTEGTEGS